MKIIFSENKTPYLEKDAKRIMAAQEERRLLPLVASVHRAVTPRECEKCNNTYWAPVDTWSSYCSKGCEDDDKKSIGF